MRRVDPPQPIEPKRTDLPHLAVRAVPTTRQSLVRVLFYEQLAVCLAHRTGANSFGTRELRWLEQHAASSSATVGPSWLKSAA